MSVQIHAIDVIILVVYLGMLAGIGLYFSKRQTNLDEFFRAHRGIAWFPVGLSLMAALNSGLDYLMMPWSVIKYGLILTMSSASWLFLYPWVANVSIPFYRRLNLYTAYEYLEHRFDLNVRTLAAAIFILWRLGWMGTALYVPCLAISGVTGGQAPVWIMVVAIGGLVTLYTMLGGIKAVVWTDVLQFCIMIGGVTATVAIVLKEVPGGIGEVWGNAVATGKVNFTLSVPGMAEAGSVLDKVRIFFITPVHFWPMLFFSVVPLSRIAGYTVDQVMVQRLQTTRSVKEARQAFIINAIGDVWWMTALAFVGMTLWAYFQHHPLPQEFSNDKILPYFMSVAFPAGFVGLVIAAILAASLSSIDSAINSCSSVVVVDFYNRLYLKRQTGNEGLSAREQRGQVVVSRIATVCLGVAMMLLALNVHRIGDLIEIANKLIGLFVGPLLAIFLLGMFNRGARSRGALIGGLAGSAVSMYVAFASSVSFLWILLFGMVTTYVVGLIISAVQGPAPSHKVSLTYREVMKRPEPTIEAAPEDVSVRV